MAVAAKRTRGPAAGAAAKAKRARAAEAEAPAPAPARPREEEEEEDEDEDEDAGEPESSTLTVKQAALDRKKRIAGAALALGIAGDKSASFVALDDSQQVQEQENVDKEAAGAAAAAAATAASEPALARRAKASKLPTVASKLGVVYLGHIPHGFFEEQMKGFFEQFGSVARVRLSRSRRTGNSRGYAFIQFDSQEVAVIVQKAMDKYILCGKLLTCELVKPENVHARMFEGADKKPRKVNRGAQEERRQARPRSAEAKQVRAQRIAGREKKRAEHLAKRGIVYELPGGGYAAKVKAVLEADFASRKPKPAEGSTSIGTSMPDKASGKASGKAKPNASASSKPQGEDIVASSTKPHASSKPLASSKPRASSKPEFSSNGSEPESAPKAASGKEHNKPGKAGVRRAV